VLDELSHSSTPEIIINNHPMPLKTKEDKHKSIHTMQEVKAKDTATQAGSDFDNTAETFCAIPETFTPILNSPKEARP
jgi:hypothetical protein